MLNCPLCKTYQIETYHQDDKRTYLNCRQCQLVFVPPQYHLSKEAEKERYDLHKNSPDDPEYRKFLNRLFEPVNKIIPAGSAGLDFGSGPGPTLSLMFSEAGHHMQIYDCFYANAPSLLSGQYDFITASEVVEHLYAPGFELNRLWSCLKKYGILAVMTKRIQDSKAFKNWHYTRDPTHVCFFSTGTFQWLGRLWQAEVEFIGDDVVLMKK